MLAREILQRVREIQVRTGRQVADVLAGEYVSVFKGRGMEFEEVRPYIPGDDVRTIDWNVTARTGTPYVKRYVEERQLTLMLMADVSASQDFGSAERSKREVTAELCALLAFSATRNDDKVGLTLFHGGIEQYIPPRKGQKHALRVVREVLAHGAESPDGGERAGGRASWFARWRRPREPREATDIANAMEFLLSVTSRKTICFVVSDFLDEGFERALVSANQKHDVIGVLVTDPKEFALPSVGLVALRDAETGEARVYDTGSAAFRGQIAEAASARVKGLEHRLRSAGIDFIHIDAAGSVVDPLVRFFRMRERRSRR
ncbi:MAG: DUF58 domain-containing protein [Deltaproteobacteria bacterium]|nr:DUF58 domain-containing protein [Deltaproteobacteria bacterium]MBW2362880.1 DUF58 domain-containing protein [Deltaproteobacteria bacterium]